jgi:hypothetical protein
MKFHKMNFFITYWRKGSYLAGSIKVITMLGLYM